MTMCGVPKLVRVVATVCGGAALLIGSAAATGCRSGAIGKPPIVRQSLDDAQMTTAVKSALLNDAQLGTEPIDVRVTEGVVSLSGLVRSAADAARAEDLVRKVSGVKDVKASLQVRK